MPKAMKKRALAEVDDELANEELSPKMKKSKSAKAVGSEGVDSEGNRFWELSAKRRVSVSTYNKTHFVNIREYYDQDGQLKPGRKGISLSVDQYQALLKLIPALNTELRKQGVEMEEPGEEVMQETKKVAKKEKSFKSKANIEATSDEESD